MKNKNLSYLIRHKQSENWIKISSDQLNQLSLEDGDRMPEIQGNKIIITNYFNMFWGKIMGSRNFRVFMVLLQFAYGDKDYSYPSLSTLSDICDMSKKTVKTAIEDLEDLGFVLQVQVYDEDKKENENNIYIIRKTVPFISVNQYNTLSLKMRKEHDKYLENIEKSERIKLSNVPDYSMYNSRVKNDIGIVKIIPPKLEQDDANTENVYEIGGIKNSLPSENINTPKILTQGGLNNSIGVGENLTPNHYKSLSITNLNHLNNHLHSFSDEFVRAMKNKLTTPSFNTWFKDISVIGFDVANNVFVIQVVNISQKEWISNRYSTLIKDILVKYFGVDDEIIVDIRLESDRGSMR